jgi:hypothetical protein
MIQRIPEGARIPWGISYYLSETRLWVYRRDAMGVRCIRLNERHDTIDDEFFADPVSRDPIADA